MPRQTKRPITAEDLYRLRLVPDCRISPDGRHVVFVLTRADRKTEKKRANLWIVPTSGGPPRQFTFGEHSDTSPRWSPDGSRIAFLSNRGDEKQPQVHVIPFDGGEARPLTGMAGTFGALDWTPDGRRLVCTFRRKDADEIEREQDEEKKKLGVVARHVTRVFYKEDGKGFLPRERWHIWTIDARTGRGTQLTEGDVHDETDPAVSPDGAWLALCSNRAPDPDLDPESIDLFVMPIGGGDMRRIDAPLGEKTMPRFSPDGSLIAWYGAEGRMPWPNTRVWVAPADGSGPARDLTGRYDLNVSNWTINDVGGAPMTPPTWSPGGRRIMFPVARHGDSTVHSVTVDGDDLQTVIGGPGVAGTFSFDRAGRRVAWFGAGMTEPGEVYVRAVATGAARRLTRVNDRLLRGIDLGHVEEVWFKGPAGNDLQGWIITPPGFDPSKRYPSILEIHGGPRTQYGNLFMHEFYFLAAHGYVVYFCNPRGGQGYGEEHAKAIWNNWGTADYEDVMAWADYVAKQPYIDPARMGVTGGSYGGYLTNWIIGHTGRFRAAVTQRCVSNLVSMYGSSDFNWAFQREFGDVPPWQDVENYWRQSPIKYIGNAKTPTMVIHSEQDLRCAIEQGEQVFVALKRLGVETEMVRFPDEPHGLSRGGRTDRRIERLNSILRWFDAHLKAE